MFYVLVKVNKGIIENVLFYFSEKEALTALDGFVRTMNPEDDDAGVFGPDGLVANAKTFHDENERYVDDVLEGLLSQLDEKEPVFIIGNPGHYLGFMVASPDDPLGYKNAAEAVSDLALMRKDHGRHLKLYRLIPLTESITKKIDVEKYNADNEIEDFDYSLVGEYIS